MQLDDYIRVYAFMEAADQFVNVPDDWEERLDALDPLVAPGWRRTRNVTLPAFARVERDRRQLELQVAELFEATDVVLTPTNACPPFAAEGPMPTEIGGRRCHAGHAALLTMFANVLNLPSITLPAGVTTDGLPIGLMVWENSRRQLIVPKQIRVAMI